MRTDEEGQPCPETLGEYRDLVAAIGLSDSEAVQYLDKKIATSTKGREEKVIAPDSQMRAFLMPRLFIRILPPPEVGFPGILGGD